MESLQHDVTQKKSHSSGNPVRRKQVQNAKNYSSFLTYIRSLTFIKNTLAGCLYPGMMTIMLYHEQSPGWCYALLLVPIIFFPFAIIAIERIGLLIAPARFWQKYHKLEIHNQNALLFIYYLLITLLVVPLAMVYFIWLRSMNHSS